MTDESNTLSRRMPECILEAAAGQVACVVEVIKGGPKMVIRSMVKDTTEAKKVIVRPRYDGVLARAYIMRGPDGGARWLLTDFVDEAKPVEGLTCLDEEGWNMKEVPTLPATENQLPKVQELNEYFGCDVCSTMTRDEFFSYRENPFLKRKAAPSDERPREERTYKSFREVEDKTFREKKVRRERVERPVQRQAHSVPALAAGMQQLDLIARICEVLSPLGIKIQMGLSGEPVAECSGMLRALNCALQSHGVRLEMRNGIPVAVTSKREQYACSEQP